MFSLFSRRKREEKKNSSYASALLASYILMILPQFFPSSAKAAVYLVCFCASVFMLVFSLFNNNTILCKNKLFMLLIYIIVLFSPIIYDMFIGFDISFNDFLDIIVRLITFLLLFLLMPRKVTLEDFKYVFIGIAVVALIASIYNIFINYHSILGFFNASNSYMLDIRSFFANRNTFAMFLFAGIFASLLLLNMNISKKRIWYMIILFELFNLLLTMSRGGLIATAIILAPSAIFYFRKHRLIAFIFLITAITVIIFIINNPTIKDTIERLYIRADAGSSGRTDLWDIGMTIVDDNNIITGIGYYTALNYSGVSQFHSLFVDSLVDGGLLGLLFKISIFLVSFFAIRKSDLSDKIKCTYTFGFIAVLFLSFIESVNIFALGSTEMLFTVIFITMPIAISKCFSFERDSKDNCILCNVNNSECMQ